MKDEYHALLLTLPSYSNHLLDEQKAADHEAQLRSLPFSVVFEREQLVQVLKNKQGQHGTMCTGLFFLIWVFST